MSDTHICVCTCTFRRPQLLKQLLSELDRQQTEGLFTYSVVVADNDRAESAKSVVSEFAQCSSIQTTYCMEPRQNIALARNAALAHAHGDFIAFIDDDEYPVSNWLCSLFKTCMAGAADGVLGPVKPCFEQEPPAWAVRGRFFERPNHKTGYRIGLSEARTGNVLFRKKILNGSANVFNAEFGTGSEDVDFFRRMMEKGKIFIWCNEAVVYEHIPASRCTRTYLLKRALLIGANSYKHVSHRTRNLIKSAVAVPLYALFLPLLTLFGQHVFMTYLTKLFYHGSRLLAMFGWKPVPAREATR